MLPDSSGMDEMPVGLRTYTEVADRVRRRKHRQITGSGSLDDEGLLNLAGMER